MDDKVFQLLEKMYVEMQEMKTNISAEMQEIKTNMATKQELAATRQDLARLESKMDSNDRALYDGYKQSIEGIAEVKNKLDKLTDRVENQEIRLQVLKSAK